MVNFSIHLHTVCVFFYKKSVQVAVHIDLSLSLKAVV